MLLREQIISIAMEAEVIMVHKKDMTSCTQVSGTAFVTKQSILHGVLNLHVPTPF